MQRIYLSIIIVLVILTASTVRTHSTDSDEIKIGAILSLSGSTSSFYGEYNKNALEIAKDEINEKGGILGKKIKIIYEDSRGDKQVGATSAQKLISVDKVNFLISDITAVSLAVAPIAEKNKTILIATSASTPDLTNAGDYVFRTKLSSTIEATRAADFLSKNYSGKKVAFLYQNSSYGTGVISKFKPELAGHGIYPVIEETYETGATDMRQQILNIKIKKPDVIILAGFPKELGVIIKQSRELGLGSQFYAHSGSIGPDIEQIAGKEIVGLQYLSEHDKSSTVFKEFAEIYHKENGVYPELFASNAYDAFNLLVQAMRICNSTSTDCIQKQLYATKDFAGASGVISYDKNGDISSREMVCTEKEIVNSKIIDSSCD